MHSYAGTNKYRDDRIHTDGRVIDEQAGVDENVEEVGKQRAAVVSNVDLRMQTEHRRCDDTSVHKIHWRHFDI